MVHDEINLITEDNKKVELWFHWGLADTYRKLSIDIEDVLIGEKHTNLTINFDEEQLKKFIKGMKGIIKEWEKNCSKCGQIDKGQTGEYPCEKCGLPTAWDNEKFEWKEKKKTKRKLEEEKVHLFKSINDNLNEIRRKLCGY